MTNKLIIFSDKHLILMFFYIRDALGPLIGQSTFQKKTIHSREYS